MRERERANLFIKGERSEKADTEALSYVIFAFISSSR